MITDYNKKTNWNIKSVCNRITNNAVNNLVPILS